MYTSTARLLRSRSDVIIAGVAGGIARYLAIDPTIVRLMFVILVFTGVGVLLYPLLWIIMPQEPAATDTPRQAARMNEEIREVFVADGDTRRPRYNSMTGAPIDPEAEIPINNLNDAAGASSSATQLKRNQQLGVILVGVGLFVLLSILIGPAFGKLLFPLALIAAGAVLLLRNRR